jgi:uncharacterized membrane protein
VTASEWAGPVTAILAMAAATYAVRFAGYWIMSRVPLTPFLRAALEALPGAIIVATVVPLAMRGGLSAWIGIAAATLAMIAVRRDIVALAAGMGAVMAARALGLP